MIWKILSSVVPEIMVVIVPKEGITTEEVTMEETAMREIVMEETALEETTTVGTITVGTTLKVEAILMTRKMMEKDLNTRKGEPRTMTEDLKDTIVIGGTTVTDNRIVTRGNSIETRETIKKTKRIFSNATF